MQASVVKPALNGQREPTDEGPLGLPSPLSMKEMRAALSDQTAWLWEGYLASGNVTLLTSLSKSGKTTLLSVLLSKLAGGELAGLPVRPSTALVLSEETSALWCGRADRVRFSNRVRWLCRPFRSKPQPEEWQALLDRVLEERRQKGLDLFVIDTLASFSPSRNENNAGSMLAALLPLQALTAAGLCVLILHHPTKGNPMPGQAARGSGALAGCVDIILEMRPFAPGDADDRRRLLQGYSRHDETPRTLAIEWTADGADYRVLGELVSN